MGFAMDNNLWAAVDQTRKETKRTNQLLELLVSRGSAGDESKTETLLQALLDEQRRTNELLAYLAKLAFEQSKAASAK